MPDRFIILDISSHQGKDGLKISQLKNVDGLIIRAAFGTNYDAYAKVFIEQAKAANIPFGLYLADYAKNVAEAVAEADFACDIADLYGSDYPLFFDTEYFTDDYLAEEFGIHHTPQMVQELTVAFCERVKARGYTAGVYFNLDYHNRFYGADFFTAHPDYVKWFARPGLPAPDINCDLWQYASNNGKEFGYNDDIDKNEVIDPTHFTRRKDEIKPISVDPIKLYIGYASSGDIATLNKLIKGLLIGTDLSDKGYITTTKAVSKGDQVTIIAKCKELGIPCVEYVEEYNAKYEALISENKKLKEENGKLSAENERLSIENTNYKAYSAEAEKIVNAVGKIKDGAKDLGFDV